MGFLPIWFVGGIEKEEKVPCQNFGFKNLSTLFDDKMWLMLLHTSGLGFMF